MKKFLRTAAGIGHTLLVLGCMAFLFLLCRAPVFERGESYALYLGTDSSAPRIETDAPVRTKLLSGGVKGESVVYHGDRYEELKARYRAVLLFTETVGGVTSYYLHSSVLGTGVTLNGRNVNLQIAVGGGQTAAGTPLIFGGW